MTFSGTSVRSGARVGLPRAALAVAVMLLVAFAPGVAAKKKKAKKPTDPEALFNPLLGIDHSRWLVGPIAHLSSLEEIEQYLRLTSDDEATAFIEAFWAKRNEGTPIFQQTPQQRFDERVEEANKRFSEGTIVGSHTDRGTIFVAYGEPSSITFEKPRTVGGPAPELWEYDKDSKPGLDGKPPEKQYRFIKLDDQTVFFRENMRRDPRLRDPLGRNRNRGFDG